MADETIKREGPATYRFGFDASVASTVKYESFRVSAAVTLPFDGTKRGYDAVVPEAEGMVFDSVDYHLERLVGGKFKNGKRA